MFATKIQIDGKMHDASVTLATDAHRREIEAWPGKFKQKPVGKIADILEYGELALTKWRYYKGLGRCPDSWEGIRSQIAADAKCEVGSLFVVTSPAFEKFEVLGFAFFRRTWSNSIVIEFLANSPLIEGQVPPMIAGVGTSLLVGISQAANEINAPSIWGEATEDSCGFYEKRFEVPVRDLFLVDREHYVALLKKAGLIVA